MASTINAALPADGVLAVKGDLRANLAAAAADFERLEADVAALASPSFSDLSDAPPYAGNARKVIAINATGDGIEAVNNIGKSVTGVTRPGDASITIVADVTSSVVSYETTLTANRTCTLPTLNVYEGLEYIIKRTAGGSFTLTVTGLRSAGTQALAQNEVILVRYEDGAWDKLDYGNLTGAVSGSTTFAALTDGPGALTGNANKLVVVNAAATALEYLAPVAGGTWQNPLNLNGLRLWVDSTGTFRKSTATDFSANADPSSETDGVAIGDGAAESVQILATDTDYFHSGTAWASNSFTNLTHTITGAPTGTDALLIGMAIRKASTAAISYAATWNAVAMTVAGQANTGVDAGGSFMDTVFFILPGAAAGTGPFAVTASGSNVSRAMVWSWSLGSCKQSSPITVTAAKETNGAASVISHSLTTSVANGMVFAVAGSDTTTAGVAWTGGATEDSDLQTNVAAFVTGSASHQSPVAVGATATATATFGGNSTQNVVLSMVEVKGI